MPDVFDEPGAGLRPLEDMNAALVFALVGHAAVLRNARERLIRAAHTTTPGCISRVVRSARVRCATCGGVGVVYTLDEARVTITGKECACVSYEVVDVPREPEDEEVPNDAAPRTGIL
jgi:hypothetical protein